MGQSRASAAPKGKRNEWSSRRIVITNEESFFFFFFGDKRRIVQLLRFLLIMIGKTDCFLTTFNWTIYPYNFNLTIILHLPLPFPPTPQKKKEKEKTDIRHHPEWLVYKTFHLKYQVEILKWEESHYQTTHFFVRLYE